MLTASDSIATQFIDTVVKIWKDKVRAENSDWTEADVDEEVEGMIDTFGNF